MKPLAINKSFSSQPDEEICNTKQEKQKMPFKVVERIKLNRLFKTYRRLEALCGFFSILTIIALVVDYEESYNTNSLHDSCSLNKSKSENYRILSVFTSFCSIILLIFRDKTESKWLIKTLSLLPKSSKNSESKSNRRFHFALEALILLIIPIPYFDVNIEVPQHFKGENISICYQLSTILFIFGFFRFFFIIRVLTNYSVFHNEQAHINCIKNQIIPGFSFTIQALSNTHPYKMIGILAFLTILIGSFVARILERPMDDHINVFHDYIINYFWFSFQTISTIGYGEYTCVSYGCRIIAVLTWFFGSVFVGFLINSMQLTTELNKKEVKSFSLIRKDKQAAKLIAALLKFNKTKKNSQDFKELENAKLALQLAADQFRELRLKVKQEFGKYDEVKAELFMIKLTTKRSLKKLDELIEMHS